MKKKIIEKKLAPVLNSPISAGNTTNRRSGPDYESSNTGTFF